MNSSHENALRNMGGSSTSCEKVHELAQATTSPTMSLPVRELKPVSWFCVVFALLAALFLFALDNTIVANIQPNIIGTLQNIDKLPWISVSFALGAVGTNLFWGQLYSLFDNKILFIVSMVIFETGSALCGAAPSLDILILGRAICGIGGMGIYMGTMNMVSALTTEVERPTYLGFVGLTWGIGTILGPIVGGAFTDSPATWRWAFYINLCIGAIAAPVYIFLVPSILPPGSPGLTPIIRIKKVDTAGALLSAGAIATLVMAISFGGGVYEWKSGQVIGLFVTTSLLSIAFVIQQRFSILTLPENRIFPVELLKSREMNILFAHMASAQVIVTLPIYFIPIYFQFAKNLTAMQSGIRLLPFVLVLVFSVMLNGALMTKLGFYMPWYFIGSALALIGSALVYAKLPHVQGYSVLAAFGVGLFSQAGFSVAQVKAAPEQLSHAVAFISVSQVGGITLVLTIANSIFLNQATKGIAKVAPAMPKVVIQQAISGFGSALFQDSDPPQRAQILQAIIHSIDEVFIMLIVAASFSLLLSVFMKRERLLRTPTSFDRYIVCSPNSRETLFGPKFDGQDERKSLNSTFEMGAISSNCGGY